MLLNATTETIQAVMLAAHATNPPRFFSEYGSYDASGNLTPGGASGALNGTTDVNIVGAPGASTTRVVRRITIHNTDTATNTFIVKFDPTGTETELARAQLEPNERLVYDLGGDWVVYTATGLVKAVASSIELDVYRGPEFIAANATTATGMASGTTYARYMGRAKKDLTQIKIWYQVQTAGAGAVTWAEIGIGSTTIEPRFANASISRLGWADISADVLATGQKSKTITGLTVKRGDHLWVLMGGALATTQWQARGGIADSLGAGRVQSAAATRISTMAIPAAFTLSTAITDPWVEFDT